MATLTRLVRDVGLAEELAQDALVAALEQWPRTGLPESPGAWLMATAKHRALNTLRRAKMLERKHVELGHTLEAEAEPELTVAAMESKIDDDIGDDLLRLMFTACHTALPTESRVALTLRLLGGLSTEEIARAFLVAEPTIAQRIVRAKRTLTEKRVPFEVPRGAELDARLTSVLEVIYLIFNEGYSASAGDDCMRPALVDEALRLGRSLAELAPAKSEVHGLLSLMELNASRTKARTDASGEPILLLKQDRTLWDRTSIERGLASLERASLLGGPPGPYAIQAAIAACHAQATIAEATDFGRIAWLYGELNQLLRSPVIELNRAVAVGMAEGPDAGLRLVDALGDEPSLRGYHLLPSARADLLVRLGRWAEARADFERAASLTQNARQRSRLLERVAECDHELSTR